MREFISQIAASRVVFGVGAVQHLKQELQYLAVHKVLILSTPGQVALAEKIAAMLDHIEVTIHAKAIMHVPIESAREARQIAQHLAVDCVVAVGGGSTIGLAKAIVLEYQVPILAIPTTYAGSEMTPVYGITENGIKKTGKDSRVLAKTVIYDPELTLNLPITLSTASGINAIAHAVEGLYAQNGNPLMSLLAEEGIKSMAEGLQQLKLGAQNIAARSQCLYGAWLCGYVLGHVGMALHHKLCHSLGGSFNLPHAATHSIILPHAVAYNEHAAPEAMCRIKRALGAQQGTAAQALFNLIVGLEAPTTLASLGMRETDLDRATEIALANPYWNPEPIEKNAIRDLLQHAYYGIQPD